MKKNPVQKPTRKFKKASKPVKKSVVKDIGVPAFIEPTIHDVQDELYRLDSYAYSQYNS